MFYFSHPVAAAAKSLQSCPTLRNPMDWSLPGSSVHGIFQARVLEWDAITFFSAILLGIYNDLTVVLGFPGSSAGKESACNRGDLDTVPGLGRCPGEGNSYPLQYSGLENSMEYPWGCKESDTTA